MSVNVPQLESLRQFVEGLQELEADTGLHLYSRTPIAVGEVDGESIAKIEWYEDEDPYYRLDTLP